MDLWVAVGVKGSVLLAAAWAATALLSKQSAAFRHLIWALALFCFALLPLAQTVSPKWDAVPVRSATAGGEASGASGIRGSADAFVTGASLGSSRGDWSRVAWWIWCAGSLAMLARVAAGFARLPRRKKSFPEADGVRRRALELQQEFGISREVAVLAGERGSMPMTYGFVRPRIVLPEDASVWEEERLRAVLAHELSHIKRLDWPVQIACETLQALCWWQPMVWIASSRLRAESELAADDLVIRSGVSGIPYAEHLMALVQALSPSQRQVVLAVAQESTLERRVKSMLDRTANRGGLKRLAALGALVIAGIATLSLAAIRLPGQSTAGLSGFVYDGNGMGLKNATIIATGPSGTAMTTSSAAGVYELAGLPSGEYTVRVLKPGFVRYESQLMRVDSAIGHNVTLRPGEEEVASAPTGAAPRIRVGGAVMAKKLVDKVTPLYPASAKEARVQGTVLLDAWIDKEGAIYLARVSNDDAYPDLARAAVEAVSKWRYQTTLLNGNPVDVQTSIAVNFTLAP
jgi:TonB family protein